MRMEPICFENCGWVFNSQNVNPTLKKIIYSFLFGDQLRSYPVRVRVSIQFCLFR